jgi:hypothetical protein
MSFKLTEQQTAIKARKFRLLAGELYIEMNNDKLPEHVASQQRGV